MSTRTTHRTHHRSTTILALALLALTAVHCDDDGSPAERPDVVDDAGDVGSDATADIADEEVTPRVETEGAVRFDLTAALDDDFFAFPYPSDLRLNEKGAPDLTSFPTSRALTTMIDQAARIIEDENQGFSPLSAVYITFNESLDADTLPADVTASLSPTASVYLIDITDESPTYGERQPVRVIYNDEGGGYWTPRTLCIHPLYGLPLRTSTTYAAVVTDDVLGADGEPLEAPSILRDLDELLAPGAPPVELADAYRPLYDTLVDLGESPTGILAATVFTTSDPAADLVSLRDWMSDELGAPVASDLALTEEQATFDVYGGSFDSVELFTGTVPYNRFGEGRFTLDEEGLPTSYTDIDLAFAISVPDGPMPEQGWPIVLYGHGLGEDTRGFIRVAAGSLAQRGIAALGISPPLQGERNPTGQADQDLIVSLSVANIVAGREILRQGVVDELRASQLIQSEFSIPESVSATGQEIAFDASRMAFIGHSEGAQIGSLFGAVETSTSTIVLSAGGGGAAITMLELNVAGIDVAATVATVAGIQPTVETFDLDHPLTTVVIQPLLDVADPLHAARRIFLEPSGGQARNLLMMEGFGDLLTPPSSTEALASAAGLPIAEPVGRAIEGLELQGIDSVALPAQANLPEVDGHRATGALLQFPDDDHYIIYRNSDARYQIFEFVESALAGTAEIPAPPD